MKPSRAAAVTAKAAEEQAATIAILHDDLRTLHEKVDALLRAVLPDPPPTETVYVFGAISAEQSAALENAGYHTIEEIGAASDEDLLAVSGIGPATLARIREALKEDADAKK